MLFPDLVLGPQFWSLLAKSFLIPRRKGKAHEDAVHPLPTALRITSALLCCGCSRMRSIPGKLMWALWLYVLFRIPWVVFGPTAVEAVPKPVSIQVLCTCSLGSEPDWQVTVRWDTVDDSPDLTEFELCWSEGLDTPFLHLADLLLHFTVHDIVF